MQHAHVVTHVVTVEPFLCRWYKDGKPVKQGEGLRVSANSRKLIVSRAQVSDTARFQCVASNEAGDHERDFNVVVQGKILNGSTENEASFLHVL